MKTKLLSIACTLVVAFSLICVHVSAQNGLKTQRATPIEVSHDYAGVSAVNTALPSGEKSIEAACDTFNLYAYEHTWTISNYSVTATPNLSSGYVNGVNTYGDKAKAVYFPNSNGNTYVLGGMIAFANAYSTTPTKTINVRIWSSNAGVPGSILATQSFTMQQVMTDVNGNYFLVAHFTPVNVGGAAFFMGVDFSGLDWTSLHDTLSIQSNLDPQTTTSATWEMQSDNLWYQYTSTSSWGLNISLAVFPVVSNSPAHASFTQSATNICTGYPVTLDATGSTQSGVLWGLPGATPSSSNAVVPTVTYANPGTFAVKLYVQGGSCNNIDSMKTSITVIASPHPNATATPGTICTGNSSVLSAANGISYQWSGYSLTTTPNQTVTPGTTTTYTVTVTASNGCSASQTATVAIDPVPAPNPTATPPKICQGNTTLLSATPGMSNYLWMPGGNTNAAFTVSPPSTTTYTVTVTDAIGCTGVNTITVKVDPKMVTTIATANAICGNSNGKASVAIANGGISPFTYSWSTSPVQTNDTAMGLAQGTYYVTVTDSLGCTMKDTAVVGCVVGLTNYHSAMEINLIPNPTAGEFFLVLKGYNDAETSVNIFNIDGQCVYNEKLKIDADVYTDNINLAAFAKGVYYVKVMSANRVKTMKLVLE